MTPETNPTPLSKVPPSLSRQIGLGSAISLNMMNIVGTGVFVTIPLVVAAMGGPQAILGWILGALIAACDGLVWAELGAAIPRAGGSYVFLREIYGRDGAGRLISFLFVWQLSFTAPLSVASGCIGISQYATYLWPALQHPTGFRGPLAQLHFSSLLAAGICVLIVALLYRNVRAITRLAWVLWAGMLLTIASVIAVGARHLHSGFSLAMPPHALSMSPGFFEGLGAATLLTTYCYWGYYNVCFLGGEVKDPERNIPRAVLISIAIVAVLYLLMNISVLRVVSWQELSVAKTGPSRLAVMAVVMQRTFGTTAGRLIAGLVMWTAFSSVFSLLLAFSRAPYIAAVEGNYFAAFARLHPRHSFPHISLLALGGVATFFCFFDLSHVIAALVAIRVILQYSLQQAGVLLLRARQPDRPRPFRIWLYPLPPLFALAGSLFLLLFRVDAMRELLFGGLVAVSGSLLFFIRAARRKEWPFAL